MNLKTEVWNEDCVAGLQNRVADESVDLTVTSIPFEELFTYSGKPEDVGNNGSTIDVRAGRFALNMRFAVAQLYRVMRPGCNVCIHIQQLLAYKNQHGYSGRRDFRGAMVDVFGAAGFNFAGEAAIPKDPQAMANKLNLISLQFKTGCKVDSNRWAPAPNDYVLIFHKPGDNPHPVLCEQWEKPRHWENGRLTGGVLRRDGGGWVSDTEWIAWAKGTWEDIMEVDVLDGARNKGYKEEKFEKHVCPLQLEVIRRCVSLYSNPVSVQPDVTVLDPFMGIGSTAWVCCGAASPMTKLKLAEPRNVTGFELKESYHAAAVANVAKALRAGEVLPDLYSGNVAVEEAVAV
jgi:DNA modification methylase